MELLPRKIVYIQHMESVNFSALFPAKNNTFGTWQSLRW